MGSVKSLAAVLTVLLSVGEAYAQMAPVPPPPLQSLDLPLIKAAVVVTGVITDFEITSDPAAWIVSIAVRETLKGDHRDRITQRIPAVNSASYREWVRTSALLLIAIPSPPAESPTIFDLTDKQLAVMTADLKLLKQPDEIVLAAKEIARRTPDATPTDKFAVTVTATTVAGTRLDNRNGFGHRDFVTVDVPIDTRLESRAREQLRAAEPPVRINGVRALRHFKSAENIARIRPLLNDPGWQDSTITKDNNKILRFQFNNVRREAYAALQYLGVNVAQPLSLRPADPDEQVVSVALDDRRVTQADVSDLARYPNLEDLYLSTQNLTDEQWATIGRLRNLKTLVLDSSNISDSTLKLLSSLSNLVYLGLSNTQVTDAGLTGLAAFRSLKKVDLGQRVTESGIAALVKRRPALKARADEFAFLAPLRARRIDLPFTAMSNYLLPSGTYQNSAGLRCYVLVVPIGTAWQMDEFVRRELVARGWERFGPNVVFPWIYYRRAGVPIVSFGRKYNVDEVRLSWPGKDFPGFRSIVPGPGERLIVISFNVDPKN